MGNSMRKNISLPEGFPIFASMICEVYTVNKYDLSQSKHDHTLFSEWARDLFAALAIPVADIVVAEDDRTKAQIFFFFFFLSSCSV